MFLLKVSLTYLDQPQYSTIILKYCDPIPHNYCDGKIRIPPRTTSFPPGTLDVKGGKPQKPAELTLR